MLPYSPLHHLLLNDFGGPLVATSANISGEPVLTDNADVDSRLGHVVESVLHHDRPIERPADDPVFRRVAGKHRPIRFGRGFAPLELELPFDFDAPVAAVGAHMKNTVTLAWGHRAVVSPHIGEMHTPRSLEVFEKTIEDLQRLYSVRIEQLVCDAHPGYTTSRWADKQGLPLFKVFHHHAHAASACFECDTEDLDEPVLAFTWDGVGYGEDGTLWGGETLLGKPGDWQRVGSLRPFYLPGGEKAGREPWRSAAALCWETGQPYTLPAGDDALLFQSWERRINAPQTSAMGRLFDAAAALSGVCEVASFEGQAPMLLEALSEASDKHVELTLEKVDKLLIINWAPLVPLMVDSTLSVLARASLLHASLARALLEQAKAFRDRYKVNTVCLTGGVFQNRILSESAMALLTAHGFNVHLPELIPVNDAGISFGQIIEFGYNKNK